VVVVGAGPAGLEAARTAALRGHRVRVYEETSRTGGFVGSARRAPHRVELGVICDWLTDELGRLGVPIELGRELDADDVVALEPDVVIAATGARERRDGVQRMRPALRVEGLELDHVATPADVLEGRVTARWHAVVFDDLGNYQAIGSAERLLQQGAEVVFATSYPEFAPDLFRSFQRDAVLERLSGFPGFGLRTRATVEAVGDGTVTLGSLDSADQEVVDAGLLVLVTGFDPDAALAAQLRADGIETHIVGDAVAPLLMPHAIATGREAGAAV
jgi:NADPH-dependent 2,4-dienoyl-CoA reductase/sulfur reductase-like enzyme